MRVEKVEIPPDILSCGLHLFYSLISKCYQHCAFIAGGKKGLPPRRPPPCRPSSVARHRERGDPMLSTSSLRWAAPCALAALWCAQAAVCAGRLWSPYRDHGSTTLAGRPGDGSPSHGQASRCSSGYGRRCVQEGRRTKRLRLGSRRAVFDL